MAAIPVAISGVIYDKTERTQRPVVIMGQASIIGLSVGGGPIIPPDSLPPEGVPPGIWQDPGGYNPDNPNQPWPEPPAGQKPPFEVKVGWTEEKGWFVVLVPTGEHPAPSKR